MFSTYFLGIIILSMLAVIVLHRNLGDRTFWEYVKNSFDEMNNDAFYMLGAIVVITCWPVVLFVAILCTPAVVLYFILKSFKKA